MYAELEDEAKSKNADDGVVAENKEPANETSCVNQSDCKETDDEIIFVENDVEVIEIDDDDDDEVILPQI